MTWFEERGKEEYSKSMKEYLNACETEAGNRKETIVGFGRLPVSPSKGKNSQERMKDK